MQDDHAERLQALCLSAVDDDGADVIIIAGAPPLKPNQGLPEGITRLLARTASRS